MNNNKISFSDLLLSIISGLLGVLLFFTYSTVDKFNNLVDAFNESEKTRSGLYIEEKARLDDVEKFNTFIYENTVIPNHDRSISNSNRILLLEAKIGE